MPIQIDKKPGRKPLRRNGEAAGPSEPPGPPEPVSTRRVRMIRGVVCKIGTFEVGKTYEMPVNTAASWIGFGLAEEDKSFDHAQETK